MIRLGCEDCDTTQHDMIDVLDPFPDGWDGVRQIQTYEQSMATEPTVFDCKTFSAFEWMTHLGVCPKCQDGRMDRRGI